MMTMPEIERCLRQLRLSGVRDTLQTRVLQAQGANQPFLETFTTLAECVCATVFQGFAFGSTDTTEPAGAR